MTRSSASKGTEQGGEHTPQPSHPKKRKIGSKTPKTSKKGQESEPVEVPQQEASETDSSTTSRDPPQESTKKGKAMKEVKPIPVDSLNVLFPTRLEFQSFENEGLNIQQLFQSAHLMPLQSLDACCVVSHVKDFYKNLRSVDDNLFTEVCGNVICFNPRLLATLLGLPYDRTVTLPSEPAEYYLKNALGKDCVTNLERDSLAHLPFLIRILGHIINKMVLPKSGSTNDLKREGFYLVDCMLNNKPFNVTDLICQHMLFIRRKLTMHLPYGDIIYKLCQHNLVSIAEEDKISAVKTLGHKFIQGLKMYTEPEKKKEQPEGPSIPSNIEPPSQPTLQSILSKLTVIDEKLEDFDNQSVMMLQEIKSTNVRLLALLKLLSKSTAEAYKSRDKSGSAEKETDFPSEEDTAKRAQAMIDELLEAGYTEAEAEDTVRPQEEVVQIPLACVTKEQWRLLKKKAVPKKRRQGPLPDYDVMERMHGKPFLSKSPSPPAL